MSKVLPVTMALAAILFTSASGQSEAPPSPTDSERADLAATTKHYDHRYHLDSVDQKMTDNHGEGFEPLYGTRNFRTVLKGVVYRGGANNKWHRSDPRSNTNPLPYDGLRNLCREGFQRSYYLYDTNFDLAPPLVVCESPDNPGRSLQYFQMSSVDDQQTYELLKTVYATIKNPGRGPIYIHCWNGWHASGLVSAKILRQFCGFSADKAVEYWDRNTDGNNKKEKYESIRRRIRDFKPYPEFEITQQEAALICP